MADMTNAESRRKYSWWWDSHISPKNSKWLQENLTDMDAIVKAMIKLIEEDADSFARRAEMYYKKRPELMKLVEEFYRAYRALAERYDNATGVIRQAHRTMAEAFPNQVPFILPEDSPANSVPDVDPCSPEMSTPVRALFDLDDLQKDALGLSSSHFHAVKRNGDLTEESNSVTTRKGLKQANDLSGSGGHAKFGEGRVRKGLNFHETEEKEQRVQSKENHNFLNQALSESERGVKPDEEFLALKEALAKLEAEKEAGLIKYQQSLKILSDLESDVSRVQEDSKGLGERASKAEVEVQILKEALTKLEAEREASHLQHRQCLDKISSLQTIISQAKDDAAELNERASKAEIEAESKNQVLAKIEADKSAALYQYQQSLDMISNLESRLLQAEEDARKFSERADKAEREIESLMQAIAKLTEEKEFATLHYQQCLETISSLELKITSIQDEAQKLKDEIDNGVAKLKGAEERSLLLEKSNQSLQSELEASVVKMRTQSQELTEKQKELGRLWICKQEERLRFMEAETAFQTLQHLHSQAQEELRYLNSELPKRAQILRDMETRNQSLQDEILKAKDENNSLNVFNLSSATSMKDMQKEIFSLREIKGKLEEEVELRVDQRNSLQQEIYCLKQELNELNKTHQAMLDQVDAVGLNPECLGSSVKKLQDENSNLKEICQRERTEKVSLLEKLEILEKLLEKNSLLENSLSDLSAELEGARGKIKELEQSYQSLMEEKSSLADEKVTLISQLQVTTENLEKVSEKNRILENSLSDAHDELEGLKAKSKSLEDSCQFLVNQNAGLINEKDSLVSQLEITRQGLKNLEEKYKELEDENSALDKEKEATLCEVQELQASLHVEKQEYASFAHMNEMRLAVLESQICLLQEEGQQRKIEFEKELDKALDSQVEMFVLQRCVRDLEEKNFCLLIEYKKLLEASKLSEQQISELEKKNIEQQMEVKSLFDQSNTMRTGIYQLVKALDIALDQEREDKIEQDQTYLIHIHRKLGDTNDSLCKTKEENQLLAVELTVLVTLLGQVRLEAENLQMEKNIIDQEFRIRTEQFAVLQSENLKLHEINEGLKLKVREGGHKEDVLTTEVENLHGQLSEMQRAYCNLQSENSVFLDKKRSLANEILLLEGNNRTLKEENCVTFAEMVSLGIISLIFKNYMEDKFVELKELGEDLAKLRGVNGALGGKLSLMEKKLEEVQMENLNQKETLQMWEDELKAVAFARDQLIGEIANGMELLGQKEMELLDAKQKLNFIENERSELHKIVDDLKREYDEVKMIRDDQGRQVLKQSEDNDCLNKINISLREASQTLEVELHQLHQDHEETKTREESLRSELQKRNNEIDMWETQAAAFFSELQMSTICQALLEEKVQELAEACESLEGESTSHDMVMKMLKEKISILQAENEGLKAQLAAYGPAVISLRECMLCLEKRTSLHAKIQTSENEEAKDVQLATHQHVESQQGEDQPAVVPDAFSDLHSLQTRVKTIEKALIEMDQLAMQENLNVHAELAVAMRQIEGLKTASSLHRGKSKPTSEISEVENGILTKDIMLDHISECSSYGLSKRENVEADNQMLELWQTVTDQDGSIDLTVGKAKKAATAPTNKDTDYHRYEAVKKQKSAYPTSDVLVEKELGVDKLQLSKRSVEPGPEGNKRKVLERLNSDVQKLTNLQITVQDLKRKLEITEKSKRGKAIDECETLKGQLEEAEETVLKLFDLNGKLMKNIEDGSFSSHKESTLESEDRGSVRRRRISEQARRMSEKIGRLQLEVQKVQFVLLRLDDEKESKGRTTISESSRRVLLKDYLYGGRFSFLEIPYVYRTLSSSEKLLYMAGPFITKRNCLGKPVSS
ncbi:unnamed protein product [Ilex paraguariensis]|uniref:NAB domain-containing protein n=1 Tax=Ilex paraguariensis TaxID=185542 RepID=A0ABC8RPW3_9AQUA